MKVQEHQGREIFSRFGIPTPAGVVVERPEDLDAKAGTLTFPVVVKAQVLVGGRGKAGGIAFAKDLKEAKEQARRILGMDIKGHTVRKVLVVPKLEFAKELYASVLIDRSARGILVMASAKGGVDIESVPDADIVKVTVDPLTGFHPFHARAVVQRLALAPEIGAQVADVLAKLYRAFRETDAELLEVNPLAVTKEGKVVAADSKVLLNDGALFRHPEFPRVDEEKTPLEQEAAAKNIAFVQLDGRIGVIANGAGLTMATLDALIHFGGKGGVFLDLGGTDDPAKVREAMQLMKRADPSVVLINLFGGITKCDTVAKGVKSVLDEEPFPVPIVTRIKGVNEKEAREILKDAGVVTALTLKEAAETTVRLSGATRATRTARPKEPTGTDARAAGKTKGGR